MTYGRDHASKPAIARAGADNAPADAAAVGRVLYGLHLLVVLLWTQRPTRKRALPAAPRRVRPIDPGGVPMNARGARGRGPAEQVPREMHHHRAAHQAGAPSAASLDPDAIRRVVVRNLGQVRRCYETALAEAPTAEGRVAVRWVIGGDGAVPRTHRRRT